MLIKTPTRAEACRPESVASYVRNYDCLIGRTHAGMPVEHKEKHSDRKGWHRQRSVDFQGWSQRIHPTTNFIGLNFDETIQGEKDVVLAFLF